MTTPLVVHTVGRRSLARPSSSDHAGVDQDWLSLQEAAEACGMAAPPRVPPSRRERDMSGWFRVDSSPDTDAARKLPPLTA